MPKDDRRVGARDQRHIEVTGSMVDGGIGGIQVGGNFEVTSNVSAAANELTERDRALVQAVLDAARSSGPAMPAGLAVAVRRLDEEMAVAPVHRSQVRALLEQVALHAGTVGAVLAAAQLALDVVS